MQRLEQQGGQALCGFQQENASWWEIASTASRRNYRNERYANGQVTTDAEITARVIGVLEGEMTAEAMASESGASPKAERWIRFLSAATITFVTVVVAAAFRDGDATAMWTPLLLAILAGTAVRALLGSKRPAPGRIPGAASLFPQRRATMETPRCSRPSCLPCLLTRAGGRLRPERYRNASGKSG